MRWSTSDGVAAAGASDGQGRGGSSRARYPWRLRFERSAPVLPSPACGEGWGDRLSDAVGMLPDVAAEELHRPSALSSKQLHLADAGELPALSLGRLDLGRVQVDLHWAARPQSKLSLSGECRSHIQLHLAA